MAYDPAKAHEYYERTKKLKGRQNGSVVPKAGPRKSTQIRPVTSTDAKASQERVSRLKAKVSKLEGALLKAQAALSEKRQNAAKEERKSFDGKTTAKERQSSQEYRNKHREELKAKRKNNGSSAGSTSTSSSNGVSDMSVEQLKTRIIKIRSVLADAKRQLSNASQQLGQLAHSELTSEPTFNEHFRSIPISRKDSVKMEADFSGYATRNNLRCSDGRTILAGAFEGNDGDIVPLVWQHGHDEVDNVLGHVKLTNVADGVRCDAFFNKTAKAQHAKEMVRHGDVKFLSIFANKLVENIRDRATGLKDVLKGNIREVSLVLAGANPGAYIDSVNIAHGDDDYETEAIITTGIELELAHADTDTLEDEETVQDVFESMTDKQKEVVYFMLGQALTVESDVQHSDTDSDDAADAGTEGSDESEDSDADTDASNDAEGESEEGETKEVADDTEAGDAVQHDNTNQEDDSMTHNVFEQANKTQSERTQITLKHDDLKGIVDSAVKGGSLKAAVEEYALAHGIENIDYLFPDAKTLESSPAFISRRMEWVDKVLNAVRKSPFSRIKTITADITPDEARARGYIKGNMKNEEFFALSKRETTPQTVYKKQKLDRDDVVDIVDLDVVAWLKAEMKVMLDEEIAGAILVGDGRSIGDDDKIKETNIRPIASDAELYVTTATVNIDDANSSIEELVDAVIENRQYYKGTGQPTFYTTEGVISQFLTVKDNFGRRIYASLSDVAAVLRVSDIVPVEVMERVSDLVGIMVNLADYTLGADRGGQATMFDDFDIDYNKLRYLIETRLSGALTQPKSAIVFRKTAAANVAVVPVEPAFVANVITVPTVTGVVYKNEAGTTLTTGAPVTVTAGNSPYLVNATPAAGYYFESSVGDSWIFEYEA